MQEVLARVVDERRAPLVDDRLDRAAGGIDRQEPQDLVPALVVDEGEAAGIGGPAVVVDAPGIVEQAVLDGDRLSGSATSNSCGRWTGSGSPGLT